MTIDQYRLKLRTPDVEGDFVEVYKRKSKYQARVKYRQFKDWGGTPVDLRIAQNIANVIKSEVLNTPQEKLKQTLLTKTKQKIRDWVIEEQINGILKCRRASYLLTKRGGWYKDPIILKCCHKGSRIFRKIRLQVSRLRQHAWFLNPNQDSICNYCSSKEAETTEHYLLKCPHFQRHRKTLLENLKPLLKKISPACKICTNHLLGYIPDLKSKHTEKRTREYREEILRHVTTYISASKRFVDFE